MKGAMKRAGGALCFLIWLSHLLLTLLLTLLSYVLTVVAYGRR